MKQLIKKLFPSLISIRNRVYNFVAHYRFRGRPAEEVFLTIYNENHWRDNESKSGTGSNKKNTTTVIEIVSKVISDFKIKAILDIPCGDFYWMRKVNLSTISYLGADIIETLVAVNQQKYNGDNVKFEKLNILTSSIPTVDLVFTRDCLVHFSYKDIYKAINVVKKSSSTYWITTTFPEHKNFDIITGDWRPLNLQASPFNFPEPLALYSEQSSEDTRHWDKSLAIWRVADL